mmetsp:Transcript_65728/g.118421  ORF Transcript_65728/g.118421 Transcript_65728/m.118421 type:complete len:236 (-) Transcript_65728:45-752(-)
MAMSVPEWLTDVFGVLGALGFMLMLTPQVVENARNKSTEGLSMGLILLWHLAAILSCAFFYCSETGLWMLLSFAAFALCCSIIEGQHVGYRHVTRKCCRKCIIIAVSLLAAAFSTALVALVIVFFRAMPSARIGLGDVAPSILIGLGFFPQYYTFCRTWSIKGFSFGVTALDVMGSVANTLAIFSLPDVQVAQAAFDAAPFLVIICFQLGLVSLACVISCSPKTDDTDSCPKVEV